MGSYLLQHFGYNPGELVYGNGARTWDVEWDVLKETFLLTFSFEDGFECIDDALQEIKVVIFRIPKELIEWVQPDWGMQLCHALECYNVTTEDGKEDPRNIHILDSEGQRKVEEPKVEIPDISYPLKTK